MEEFYLLSEVPELFQRLFQKGRFPRYLARHWKATVFLSFQLSAIAVLLLGHAAGTNFAVIQFNVTFHDASGAKGTLLPIYERFGYASELNHGLLYLVLVAIFCLFRGSYFASRPALRIARCGNRACSSSGTEPKTTRLSTISEEAIGVCSGSSFRFS